MKKLLIATGFVILVLIVIFITIGNFKVNPNQNSKSLEQTEFYNKFYNTDKILLINVYSTGINTILQEDSSLQKYIEENNIDFISLSTSTDVSKIKNNFEENKFIERYDLTIKDFSALDKIFEVIKFKDIDNNLIKVSFKITPYIVIIKDKKVLYSSNELNMKEIKNTISKIQK